MPMLPYECCSMNSLFVAGSHFFTLEPTYHVFFTRSCGAVAPLSILSTSPTFAQSKWYTADGQAKAALRAGPREPRCVHLQSHAFPRKGITLALFQVLLSKSCISNNPSVIKLDRAVANAEGLVENASDIVRSMTRCFAMRLAESSAKLKWGQPKGTAKLEFIRIV